MDFEVVERSIPNFSSVVDHGKLSTTVFGYIKGVFRGLNKRINLAAIRFGNSQAHSA